jgi:predicted secreted protein
MGRTRLGHLAKLYVDTVNNWTTPMWIEVPNVSNLTLNLSHATADVTTRAHAGWRTQVATLKEATIEFDMLDVAMLDVAGDPSVAQIRQAFFNRSQLHVLCLNGPRDEAGSWGIKSLVEVTRFNRAEQMGQAIVISVTFVVSPLLDGDVYRYPEYFEVTL